MDRRILLQVTAPAVLIGLVLFGTCLVSAWIVNRLQANMTRILSQNVTSLEAAHDVEVSVRRLRLQCFRYLVDPEKAVMDRQLRARIDEEHRLFGEALEAARRTANTPEEQECIREIEDGYGRYRREFERLRGQVAPPWRGYRELAEENPIHLVLRPCERFLQVNKELMQQTRHDSERVGSLLQAALLLLGLGGPASGLIIGYGMARGLSRSIYRLSVRVQDVAQHLEQDVASVSVVPDGDMRNLDRHLGHVLGRVQEVAGRLQQQQREMLRAQQLAAVGQLAASVAHEIRNPLTAIKMLVDAALRPRNPRPFTRENLTVVHREVARLERTVQGFLDFARPPALRRQVCDLRPLVSRALDLVRARAEQQRVSLDAPLGDGPVLAEVDPDQFGSVLVNLLFNALDALPGGGRVEVRLSAPGPDGVTVTVRDTGAGIPPAMEGRLFTPFASTKATGTGLGLCICRRVVEEHGGKIRGGNAPEGGACFTVTLPRPRGGEEHADVAGD
jgi:signal transduction histidine kinase